MSSVLLHLLILSAVIVAAIAALRMAPRLGLQFDALPFAGVFGFVGAAFGIVLGMTTFFASQHYAGFRQAAQSEATSLGNAAAMSGAFPRGSGDAVRRQIYCYATDVIEQEWPHMASDNHGLPIVEARQAAAYIVLLRVGRGDPRPTTWYSNAVGASLRAGENRQHRLLLSQPQIPEMLWILIYVGAALTILFTFFFHLKSRRQLAGMMAAVIVMLTAIVAALATLDAPTQGPLGLQPDAMRAEQRLLADTISPRPKDPARYCRAVPTPSPGASTLG
jgi:hypothetical protein